MKILIVDDSRMDRMLLKSTLKKFGITNEILEATNGEEGLKVLSENHQGIGLILLDWQMPVMDGLEFMRAVLGVPAVADKRIIMITASSSEDSQKQVRDVNPNLFEYVVKPYKPETLANIVKQSLN